MWRLKAALAAVLFLPATCGSAAWAQSGLLLGLGRPCLEEPCETIYRTLWIAPHGGTVQIVELADLIVPRRVGVAAMQAVDDICFPKHNGAEWYIERNRGRWVAYGAFDTHRLCGVYVQFDLPFPTALAGPAATPISLDIHQETGAGRL